MLSPAIADEASTSVAEIIATTLTVRMCHIAHLPKRKLQAIVAPCELLCLAHLRADRHGFDGGLNVMWIRLVRVLRPDHPQDVILRSRRAS